MDKGEKCHIGEQETPLTINLAAQPRDIVQNAIGNPITQDQHQCHHRYLQKEK